ncbi:hypothetical protein ACOMHN_021400 [Nucella lapillus]
MEKTLSSLPAAQAQIPGWKIESHFKPGVLIGNWNEENRNFIKGNYKHNSTYRTNYYDYGPCRRPDVIVRRQGEQHNTGLPAELLLHHHGNKYANNLVTWYDEDYNGRWREKNMPPLRHFDNNKLKWEPEKSDLHVQEPPTNFGLLPELQKKWAVQLAEQDTGDYLTTYTLNYTPYIPLPRLPRFATPRLESTTLHPVNKTLKDLHLRNTPVFKRPELLPAEMTYVSN